MPAVTPSFRYAGPSDVDAIVRLVESAYRGDSSRVGWTTEADLLDGQRTDPEEVLTLTRDRSARLLLAQRASELVGCVLIRAEAAGVAGNVPHEVVAHEVVAREVEVVAREVEVVAYEVEIVAREVEVVAREAEIVAHIGMFAVRPTLQSRGLGSALLAEAERVAREELGAASAEMTVIEQRLDLLPWYERRGYRRTGATEPFPYGNPRFGLPRRADLRFLVLAKPLT